MKAELHISTVTNQNSVLYYPNIAESLSKKYLGNFTQTGVTSPVAVSSVINTTGGTMEWSYISAGIYLLTSSEAGLFEGTNLVALNVSNTFTKEDGGGTITSYGETVIQVKSPTVIQLEVFDGILGSKRTDDFLENANINIVINPILDLLEDGFNAILGGLDNNQLLIWNKIVLREGDVVTEVDGKKYRNTGVFATSSKIIES
jgi:hypothetical protein